MGSPLLQLRGWMLQPQRPIRKKKTDFHDIAKFLCESPRAQTRVRKANGVRRHSTSTHP